MTTRRRAETWQQASWRMMWADRTSRLRAALAGHVARGTLFVWSKQLERDLDIPLSIVRRMGLEMIDQCQVPGVVVKYGMGAFMMEKPDVRAVD